MIITPPTLNMRTPTILLNRLTTLRTPPNINSLEQLNQLLLDQTTTDMFRGSTEGACPPSTLWTEDAVGLGGATAQSPEVETADEGGTVVVSAVESVPCVLFIEDAVVFFVRFSGCGGVDQDCFGWDMLFAAGEWLACFEGEVPAS